MRNLNSNFKQVYWLKKSLSTIGMAGFSILIGLPALSQSYYPPMVYFQPLAYPSYPQRNGIGDIIESLKEQGNYKNLLYELEESGLAEQLKQEELTMIAPSDEAFNALSDEAFNKFSDPQTRIKVLQYHLIPGKVTAEDIERGEITTLAGEKINVSNDNSLKLNDVETVFPSIITKNGIIIKVDKVLFPSNF